MERDERPGSNDVPTPVMVDVGDHAPCAQVRGKGPTVVLDCGASGQGIGDWGEDLQPEIISQAVDEVLSLPPNSQEDLNG